MSFAIACALGGCAITEIDRPIGLVAKDLDDNFAANLAEAGKCWNLQFGTQFVSGPDAESADQQVDVFFDKTTCLTAPAQVQGGWPESIAICPERYWDAVLGPYSGGYDVTAFRVLTHELGHVANIVGHPDHSFAVMRQGGAEGTSMFAPVDRDMFAKANPRLAPPSSCNSLIRSSLPGTAATVGHCACDDGERPDLTTPIRLTPAPNVDAAGLSNLEAAARCWNLRYGFQFSVGPHEPGTTVIDLENCPRYGQVVFDRGAAYECGDFRDVAAVLGSLRLVFGVKSSLPQLYRFPLDDDDWLGVFYGVGVQCQNIVIDSSGDCGCADP